VLMHCYPNAALWEEEKPRYKLKGDVTPSSSSGDNESSS
jgi:hypothetical protein